jgi:hypothetical protein
MDPYYAQWRGPVKQWCVIGSNGIVMGEGIPDEAEADRIVAERNAQAGDTLEGLRARIAQLEARINVAADQIARLEVERWEFADECATMAAALLPLAALTISADNVVSAGIEPCHVKAARAALEGEG